MYTWARRKSAETVQKAGCVPNEKNRSAPNSAGARAAQGFAPQAEGENKTLLVGVRRFPVPPCCVRVVLTSCEERKPRAADARVGFGGRVGVVVFSSARSRAAQLKFERWAPRCHGTSQSASSAGRLHASAPKSQSWLCTPSGRGSSNRCVHGQSESVAAPPPERRENPGWRAQTSESTSGCGSPASGRARSRWWYFRRATSDETDACHTAERRSQCVRGAAAVV